MRRLYYKFAKQLKLANPKYNQNVRSGNNYRSKYDVLIMQKPEDIMTKEIVVGVKPLTILNYRYTLIKKKNTMESDEFL